MDCDNHPMTSPRYTVGLLVTHPNRPEWGPGKVLDVAGDVAVICFRDAPETKAGEGVKRIDVKRMPLPAAPSQTDPWLDALPPLKDGRLPNVEPRVTPEQSVDQFVEHF